MPSFGEKLKQEREKRKITLEQISSSTKIGTRMLQALEEGKFNQLPGGIFNKGFVRAYSRVVGLDEDQTVAEYLQASGDAAPVSTEIAPREDGARENEENISRLEAASGAHPRQLPWGLFAALLLLIALALSLWSHRQRERARQTLPVPTSAVAPLPAAPSSGDASGKVSNPIDNENRASGSSTAGSSTTGSSTAGSPTNGSPINRPPVGESAPAAAPAATPGEFTVVIQAQQESWTSITADGKPVASPVLAAGSNLAINGRKEIVVKVGNAGGVNFRFNGKKVDAGGASGEVKTLTFGPQGILPNAFPPELPASR